MSTKMATDSENRLTAKQFDHVAKVLAEPRRVQILKEIAASGGHIAFSELVTSHNITSQTLSHHVRELKLSGLIEIVREGRCGTLHLQRNVLQAYLDELSDI
jgi:ArsR family transcriptional regulator, arsenate/arsenite/antimonite-responsive transcriptional repressor